MNLYDLATKIETRISTHNTIKGANQAIHALLTMLGILFVPFGVGNLKTNLPGFYRKVGDTCPPTCPYLNNGCYSQVGHVLLCQLRAINAVFATVAAFVASAIMSHKYRDGAPCRMFVSGDLYKDGKVDRPLIDALKAASLFLQGFLRKEVIGYGYTHGHDKDVIEELRQVGIILLESDYFGPGGAIVHPFEDLKELKKTAKEQDFSLTKCPAQLSKEVTCSSCLLCAEAPEKKLCIVLDPHGSGKDSLPLQFKEDTSDIR